jgi:hypothetical protein
MKQFLWVGVFLALASCKKNEEYPIEPAISFKELSTMISANGKDSMAVFVVSFTDGDGDLGLRPDDTLPPFNSGSQYYRNFQLEMFEKINGVFTLNPISPQLGGRMPYLTPAGSNKALKGEIQMESNLPIGVVNDTCYFNVFIYDRALHKSNVVQTPEIVINTN